MRSRRCLYCKALEDLLRIVHLPSPCMPAPSEARDVPFQRSSNYLRLHLSTALLWVRAARWLKPNVPCRSVMHKKLSMLSGRGIHTIPEGCPSQIPSHCCGTYHEGSQVLDGQLACPLTCQVHEPGTSSLCLQIQYRLPPLDLSLQAAHIRQSEFCTVPTFQDEMDTQNFLRACFPAMLVSQPHR